MTNTSSNQTRQLTDAHNAEILKAQKREKVFAEVQAADHHDIKQKVEKIMEAKGLRLGFSPSPLDQLKAYRTAQLSEQHKNDSKLLRNNNISGV